MLLNLLHYYGLYTLLLLCAWLIGAAINTWLATRFDHQAITMPNLSCSLFVMTTTGLGVIICCLFLLALLQLFNLKTILLTGILLGGVASIFSCAKQNQLETGNGD